MIKKKLTIYVRTCQNLEANLALVGASLATMDMMQLSSDAGNRGMWQCK